MKILIIILFFSIVNAQLLTDIDNQLFHLKGNTGVTVTGAGVSTWSDQSGNSNDFTQSTDADRPEYVSSTYLDFDNANTEFLTAGDDDSFTFGDGSSTDSPFSIMAYINMDDATKFRIISKGDGSEAEYLFSTSAGDALVCYLYDSATSVNIYTASSAITAQENTWITVAMTYDGSSANTGILLYIDGVAISVTPGSAGSYSAMHNHAHNLNMGFYDVPPDYADGSIQDIIMTTDVLTPTEITNLHTYFTTGTYPSSSTANNDIETPSYKTFGDYIGD